MSDPRDTAKEKKKKAEHGDGRSSGGGNVGAGRSGKEGMGSEKPSDDPNLGSQKPGGSAKD